MTQENKDKLGKWYLNHKEVFDSLDDLSTILGGLYATKTIFPEPHNIFRAFHETPYNELKCIIIGQEPHTTSYWKEGKEIPHANGIAFSSDSPVLPKSLEYIKEAIIKSNHLFIDQDLLHLAHQGVLLLNTALTVEKNIPNAHKELWFPFIYKLVSQLSKPKYTGTSGLVWILMGKNARDLKHLIDLKYNYVLECQHPASAAYSGLEWDFKNCFNQCNDIIAGLNGIRDIIYW